MEQKVSTDFNTHRRAQDCIAQGALTNSKRPQSYVMGIYPTHVKSGSGAFLVDEKNKKYVDFVCALGTNLAGYANTSITNALARQASNGFVYSLSSTLEVQAAERFKQIVPFVDQLKFLKTGTEACMAAIKIARAYQGVCYGNEDLYKMRPNAAFDYVSSKESRQAAGRLQELYKEISIISSLEGNQEACAAEILEHIKRQIDGNEARAAETRANQIIGEGQGICNGSPKANQAALSGLRFDEPSAGSPSRLQQAARRNMAMSTTSRGGSPRVLILSEGYHGFSDPFVSLIEPRVGVVNDPYIMPLQGNEDLVSEAAAVIIEPIMTDASSKRIEWLKELREKCTSLDVVLIFDEIITGFRFPGYTASKFFGIEPDLICMGKAIGGGLPLSLVGGKKKYMSSGEYFVSSTFAGDTAALACGLELINLLHNKLSLNELFEKANLFQDKFNAIAPNLLKLEGYGTRATFVGELTTRALFCQEACRSGILFHPSTFFFNFCHIDLMDQVLNTCTDILTRIKAGSVKLQGELPASPFAAQMRNQK